MNGKERRMKEKERTEEKEGKREDKEKERMNPIEGKEKRNRKEKQKLIADAHTPQANG